MRCRRISGLPDGWAGASPTSRACWHRRCLPLTSHQHHTALPVHLSAYQLRHTPQLTMHLPQEASSQANALQQSYSDSAAAGQRSAASKAAIDLERLSAPQLGRGKQGMDLQRYQELQKRIALLHGLQVGAGSGVGGGTGAGLGEEAFGVDGTAPQEPCWVHQTLHCFRALPLPQITQQVLQQQVLPLYHWMHLFRPPSLPLPQISAQVFQQQRRASALAAQIESMQELLADAQQGVKNAQATVRAAQQLRYQPQQMQAQAVSFHTFLSGLQYDRLSGAQGGWYAGKLLHLLLRRRDAKLGEPAGWLACFSVGVGLFLLC